MSNVASDTTRPIPGSRGPWEDLLESRESTELDAVHRRHRPWLVGWAAWYIRRHAPILDDGGTAAADFADEALFRMILPGTVINGPVRPWLQVTARNLIITELRKVMRRGGAPQPLPSVNGGKGIDLPDPCPIDPSSALIQGEQTLRLQMCLAKLPARERDALESYYLEGDSTEAISVRYDSTQGAIRGVLRRARNHMRECLEKGETVAS